MAGVTLRWLVVLAAAAALVAAPVVVEHRPGTTEAVPPAELAARVQASAGLGWSGLVSSQGSLQVPASDSFSTLAPLLGEDNRLRVWWRGPDDWRVDRLRSTGETDLFRQGGMLIRWVFESETATISPVSRVRLPDAVDLVPPTLGRTLLQGARPAELTALPARRVAGVDAPGLRLTPDQPGSTVGHVDLWADPGTGLPLRVELTGTGGDRPVLTTSMDELDRAVPPSATTVFRPSTTTRIEYEPSVDVAAAANAYAAADLPPRLAGLTARDGQDPGPVGVYGRGATTLLVLPLRGSVAEPLRDQLRAGGGTELDDAGTYAPVGPVGLLVTPASGATTGAGFLLAGTVDVATLRRAAAELAGLS